jgi:Mu transposase-like protein
LRFDNNKYSVSACAVGRPVEVHAYADRIVVRRDGRIVAEHTRNYCRGETVYDPWHYVPVLARKPGALRNSAPFKDWVLPAALEPLTKLIQEKKVDTTFLTTYRGTIPLMAHLQNQEGRLHESGVSPR